MRNRTRSCDHHRSGTIVPLTELFEPGARHRADEFFGAGDRITKRMPTPVGGRKKIVDVISGVIEGFFYLFDYDLSFAVHIGRGQGGPAGKIGQHINRIGQEFIKHASRETGMLAGSESVKRASERFERGGDLPSATLMSALKDKMLYEMRQTVFISLFASRSDIDPDP